MPDEINVTAAIMEIREKVSAIQTEMQHVSARLEGKSSEIKELERRMDALEKSRSESRAVWFDYIIKGVATILLGWVAVKLGLSR